VTNLPAQSLDGEESVLGACLISAGAVDACSEILTPEVFYRQSHGVIFQAILDVAEKGEPVDALTVVGRLDADGKLTEAGGAERVHELSAIVPSAGNAAHYAKIIRAMWLRREIANVGHELVALGDNGAESVTDLFGEIDKKFLRLQSQGTRGKDRVFTAKQLVAEYRETLASPLDEDKEGVRPPFSFLSPLMGSRLYVIGGYTGHGKSVSGIQFLASACEGGARVGFHSIEMSRTDLTHRLIASFGAPYHDVRTGHVASSNRPTVDKALETIEGWDWEIIDDEEVDPAQIRRDQRSGKYDLLIIDHLHRIRIKDKRHGREELEENVRRITNIAKEFDIPVLLLAQLSREEKRNPFPRPTLASLKGSGAIEQEASHVWFAWRKSDEFHQPTSDAEWIISKNRFGPVGYKNLHFRASQVRFTETSAFA
jgi:replicative DNA helicase